MAGARRRRPCSRGGHESVAGVEAHGRGRSRAHAAETRRPDRSQCRRARAPRVARHRPPAARLARARRAAHGGVLSLLRRHGRQVPGRDDSGRGGLPQLHAARAGRRGRPGGAVELSADVHQLEDGARARRRQHHRDEARRGDAAHVAEDCRADAPRRACPMAWSTSCRVWAPWPVRRSPSMRASTRSRSPAAPPPAARSCRPARAT